MSHWSDSGDRKLENQGATCRVVISLLTISSWEAESVRQKREGSVLFVSWTWHIDTRAGKRHFNRTSKEPGQRSGWGHNLLQNYLHTQLSVWALGRNHNRERRGLSSVVPITAGNLIKLHKKYRAKYKHSINKAVSGHSGSIRRKFDFFLPRAPTLSKCPR